MDRALDDVISDRQQRGGGAGRGRRGRRTEDFPRDGVRKSSQRDDSRNLDRDWVHDRFEDDDSRPSRNRGGHSERPSQRGADTDKEAGYKIRIENLHYDLTEEDLYELFERIGPVENARLLYDRSDRSEGVAYVTYRSLADARVACREFDGANAHGQPIRLTLMPPGPARRNPFDTVQRPARSLFDRIETGVERNRSSSPARVRHSDVSKPAPAGIDRYVPGENDDRRRSPARRRGGSSAGGGGGRESGRRPGAKREPGRGRKTDEPSQPAARGRPRKTVEELDAEMADYFGGGGGGAAGGEGSAAGVPAANGAGAATGAPASAGHADDDIDMVE